MDRFIGALARATAWIGGLVLLGLIVLTCASILGRAVNVMAFSDTAEAMGLAEALKATGLRQIRGDFEMLESGIAFAIFAFLPLCQVAGGHATVDVFTDLLRPRATPWIAAFWEAVLTLAICLFAWRLFAGTMDKMGNGQVTFILSIPIWWSYLASLIAALIASVVGLWCAWMRLREALGGTPFGGADGRDAANGEARSEGAA